MRFKLNVPTKRGVVLNGVLFRQQEKRTTDTVMIAITGIHGNFYILAGHSLGANKVIYYLSRHHDQRVGRFFLLSPANLDYMMCGTRQRR